MTTPDHSPTQHQPQIEVTTDDDNGPGSGFFTWLGAFLVLGGAAIFLLIGDNWRVQIEDRVGGRRSFPASYLADFGQTPTIALLFGLATLFLVAAIVSWIRAGRTD